jgi:hypothetical protein
VFLFSLVVLRMSISILYGCKYPQMSKSTKASRITMAFWTVLKCLILATVQMIRTLPTVPVIYITIDNIRHQTRVPTLFGNDQYQSVCDFIEQILKHKFVRQSWKGTLNSIHCVVLSEPVWFYWTNNKSFVASKNLTLVIKIKLLHFNDPFQL